MVNLKKPAGPATDEIEVSSTKAQNQFGEVLRIVQGGARVIVRRRGRREAIIIPIDQYRELERQSGRPLSELEERFDAMVGRMREGGAIEALDRALATGPDALTTRIESGDG